MSSHIISCLTCCYSVSYGRRSAGKEMLLTSFLTCCIRKSLPTGLRLSSQSRGRLLFVGDGTERHQLATIAFFHIHSPPFLFFFLTCPLTPIPSLLPPLFTTADHPPSFSSPSPPITSPRGVGATVCLCTRHMCLYTGGARRVEGMRAGPWASR
jgi:hypothetical protein